MRDRLRTHLARFIVQHLLRPRLLVFAAYLWLTADAEETEQRRRCLKAILELDPDNEPASLALLLLDQRRPES